MTKAKTSKPVDIRTKAIEAALAQAAFLGWDHVTLQDIAEEAKISLAALHDHFEDKFDILAGLGRMIDRKTLERLGKADPGTSERDRLFDIIMERFEVLNEHREGVLAILSAFKHDPKQALMSGPHLCRSMCWMLEASGISTFGMRGAARLAGMSALYMKVLRVWMRDESPDLSATMAALDKDLARVENLARTLGL